MEGIPDDLGTAVNVQTMVYGNKGDDSGTGVAFTRNPSTGESAPYGDFLTNAQGEDVVAGIRMTEPLDAMANDFSECHVQLLDVMSMVERHYRDMCDIEFTIEQGRLFILQDPRRQAYRDGRAPMIGGLPTASYRIEFYDCGDNDVPGEFFNDKATLAAADPIAVTAGANSGGQDAELGYRLAARHHPA